MKHLLPASIAATAIAGTSLAVVGNTSAAAALPITRISTHSTGFTEHGQSWSGDKYYLGGVRHTIKSRIVGGSQSIFGSERTGMTAYNIPVTSAGRYQVSLFESEGTRIGRGKRVFDVYAEGQRVLSRLDIYAAVGVDKPLVKTFTVAVKDRYLNLTFARHVGVPKVDAITVTQLPALTAARTKDTQPPTAATGLHTTTITSSGVGLAWNAATDNVGVTKYEVWRGDANYDNWVLVGSVGGGTRTYTDAVPAGSYTYAIRAFDAAGNKSPSSNAITATVPSGGGQSGTTSPTPSPSQPAPSPTQSSAAPTPTPTTTPTTTPTASSSPSSAPSPSTSRAFAPNSPWNLAIPASPRLDPNSAGIAANLSTRPGISDIYEFGVPVWEADATTPKVSVKCTEPWGTCQLSQQQVPMPTNAVPSSGSDGAMVVVDHSTNKAYEFWQAQKLSSTSWQTSWGGVVDITGSGTPGQAVGAGVSRLAGLVRVSELQAGHIDHALVFSTSLTCPSYRYPATKSDGHSSGNCIPEGGRIQLDPSINVDAISGITPGERMVAHALQTYGAYAIDTGGANMAFIFETPSGESDPYAGLGLSDYGALSHIPWTHIRVLNSYDGS
jgi:hypothetical protein